MLSQSHPRRSCLSQDALTAQMTSKATDRRNQWVDSKEVPQINTQLNGSRQWGWFKYSSTLLPFRSFNQTALCGASLLTAHSGNIHRDERALWWGRAPELGRRGWNNNSKSRRGGGGRGRGGKGKEENGEKEVKKEKRKNPRESSEPKSLLEQETGKVRGTSECSVVASYPQLIPEKGASPVLWRRLWKEQSASQLGQVGSHMVHFL